VASRVNRSNVVMSVTTVQLEYGVLFVCRGGDKLEFTPASSQLLFAPVSVEVVVDSGVLHFLHLYKFCSTVVTFVALSFC